MLVDLDSTTLLVASTGGHLSELLELRTRIAPAVGSYRWVTFDTPQSRSALAGEPVSYVRFVGSRDSFNVMRNVPSANRIIRENGVGAVISTGAAMMIPIFLAARARGIRCHFIESAARADGPSTSGRIVSRIPGIRLYTQYEGWADDHWSYRGSVFDAFAPEEAIRTPAIRKVVVSLGTHRGFPFRRVVSRLLAILPPSVEVLWQTGDTDVSDLPIVGHDTLPQERLFAAIADADVVVAHAGVGTALAVLKLGKLPVLVPRRRSAGEHVDDHQIQVASDLARRRLALNVDAERLGLADLEEAARWRAVRSGEVPPIVLS